MCVVENKKKFVDRKIKLRDWRRSWIGELFCVSLPPLFLCIFETHSLTILHSVLLYQRSSGHNKQRISLEKLSVEQIYKCEIILEISIRAFSVFFLHYFCFEFVGRHLTLPLFVTLKKSSTVLLLFLNPLR